MSEYVPVSLDPTILFWLIVIYFSIPVLQDVLELVKTSLEVIKVSLEIRREAGRK